MSQTSSAHFIMQMRLARAAQISPPFEIGGCCLLFFFHSSFFSLWVVSEKALWFLADSWSLGERGRQEGGGTHRLLISSLSHSFLSLQKAVGGHEYRASHPFSFQTAWQGLARRGQPGVGNGDFRIGRGTQKPLSLGAEPAAGPNLGSQAPFLRYTLHGFLFVYLNPRGYLKNIGEPLCSPGV